MIVNQVPGVFSFFVWSSSSFGKILSISSLANTGLRRFLFSSGILNSANISFKSVILRASGDCPEAA